MKRHLLIVVVFVVLGTVANLASAWLCSVWLGPYGGFGLLRGDTWLDDTRLWTVHSEPGPGLGEVDSFVQSIQSIPEALWVQYKALYQGATPAESVIPRWSHLKRPSPEDPATMQHRFQSAFGWPWLSLSYDGVYKQGPRAGITLREISRGIVLYEPTFAAGDRPFRALPLRPLWVGFLANTAFYSAGLWLVWFLKILRPFTLLRRLRIKRGLCPACGYAMGQSTVCSECGRPLPSRSGVT